MSTSRRRENPKKQKSLRTETTERLEAIVEAAERAAESVIDDAEAQAQAYLAQAREEADRLVDGRAAGLGDLIETLLGQAIALRGEAERLQATLEEARTRLDPPGHDASQPAPAQPASGPEAPSPPEPPRLRAVAADEDSPQPFGEGRPDAAGARLLATQLAVSGSSREEIEVRLRNQFEIEDTKPILDAILGPED